MARMPKVHKNLRLLTRGFIGTAPSQVCAEPWDPSTTTCQCYKIFSALLTVTMYKFILIFIALYLKFTAVN